MWILRIVNSKRLITSILIITLIISILNCVNAKKTKVIESYTVAGGDTLWSIASKFTPKDQDIRKYIYELRKLNNLDDCIIYPNQIINIIQEK